MKKITVKINKKSFFLVSIIIILFLLLSFKTSYSNLTPVKSVKIPSTTLSYTNNEEGAWNITKSAKWLSKGKARITINVDSIVNAKNINTDVILVLDISGSMNGERLDKVKIDTINLINDIIPKGNDVALITFSDTSTIISDFTSNSEILIDHINNLEAIGNTNYYQALVNVDTILKNYKFSDTRDCVVMFLTDGYPNIDSPNEIGQYNYLKTTYPNLTINGIQYEMGNETLEPLKVISDNQHIASVTNLKQFLYKSAVSPISYDKFKIIDYIEEEYFSVENIASIKTSSGTATLEGNKVVWNLENYKTGTSKNLTIDINLKNELLGVGGIYPTNESLSVEYKIKNISATETSKLTPILSDNYNVIYNENEPFDCQVTNMPTKANFSVFDTVGISNEEPKCEGYKFKGWEIISENVTKINSDYFVMPEDDVIINAKWSKLNINKSMTGQISNVQNLYQMMADNSTIDNIPSEFVVGATGVNFEMESSLGAKPGYGWVYGDTNGKGIYLHAPTANDEYPIYYYRGDVKNNNIIFANFCWQIVRTTNTGGIKLIYNGVPTEEGSCTATSSNNHIGAIAYNTDSNSISSAGYMYGKKYGGNQMNAEIAGLGGKTTGGHWNAQTTNFIYATSVTYDNETGLYTLVDGENRIWNDTYSVGTGNQYLYTCLSETETQCEIVRYVIESKEAINIGYVSFSNGETADLYNNKEIIYGNDVTYDETTGMYTLINTISSKVGDWKNEHKIIAGTDTAGYHYTCLNAENHCKTVTYIYYVSTVPERSYGQFHYLELSNGENIESVVAAMTIESTDENDSSMKAFIDNWYENNLIGYSHYLEDTTWCNERTILTTNGWTKDGNAMNGLTYLQLSKQGTNLLSCSDKRNVFTVNDTINGNGKLKYPIALLTADEVNMAGGAPQRKNTTYYLNGGIITMTPNNMHVNNAVYVASVWLDDGRMANQAVSKDTNVRPSISLIYGIKTYDGDGTAENPFIIKNKS